MNKTITTKGIGTVIEYFGSDPGSSGSDPESGGSDPESEGSDPESRGSDPGSEGSDPGSRGSDPGSRGSDPESRGSDPESGENALSHQRLVVKNLKKTRNLTPIITLSNKKSNNLKF